MAIFKKFNKTENRHIYWIDYYDENGIRRRESTGSSSHSFAKEFQNKKLDEVAHRKKRQCNINSVNMNQGIILNGQKQTLEERKENYTREEEFIKEDEKSH